MIIYPTQIPSKLPYTKSNIEMNGEKKQLIQCNYCRYSVVIPFIPAPYCGICDHEMISCIPNSDNE